jgi:phage regulator Rha-like protein
MGFLSGLKDTFSGGSSWLGTTLSVGSSLLSGYSSMRKADDLKKQSKAEQRELERVAKDNAELSRLDAANAYETANRLLTKYNVELAQHYRGMDRLLSAQRKSYADGGVRVGTGTPLQVQAQTAFEAEKDALMIRYNGMTARERAIDAAKKYEMLADKGLRDAANQASIIEDAYNTSINNAQYAGYVNAATSVYDFGVKENWWK